MSYYSHVVIGGGENGRGQSVLGQQPVEVVLPLLQHLLKILLEKDVLISSQGKKGSK